jgi:hypothetical protein
MSCQDINKHKTRHTECFYFSVVTNDGLGLGLVFKIFWWPNQESDRTEMLLVSTQGHECQHIMYKKL